MADSGPFAEYCKAELQEVQFRGYGRPDTVSTMPILLREAAVTSVPIDAASQVLAPLTFLVPGGPKPKVVMPADESQAVQRTGTYRSIPVSIHDARHLPISPTLDREGFELVRAPTTMVDFLDAALVQSCYYAEVVELLKRSTGANAVHVFDHTVRLEADGTQRAAGLRQPVAFVHNDYTERSAQQRVRDFFPPQEARRLLAGRVAFVNVWRPISASAERFPLAAADARSIPQRDFMPVDMIYADRIGEIYHVTYSSGQRWFYFSNMGPDEAMLLKCFDSASGGRARYTAHTGFPNPIAPPDTPARRSIEVRALLAFGNNP
jgi:hypothetical protein